MNIPILPISIIYFCKQKFVASLSGPIVMRTVHVETQPTDTLTFDHTNCNMTELVKYISQTYHCSKVPFSM